MVFLYLHMAKNNPIGLFDSGIGGTSIWREINHLLPYENTVFLADSKNAPYGQKTKSEIINLCFKNIDILLNYNCKIIVIACNTATTNAISEIRANYNIPIIGIEPAIKPAATFSRTSKIGVLATKGTILSDLFTEKIKLYPETEIIEQIGYGLVELIEAGKINSVETKSLLEEYLTPMIEKGIDTLVLGCTHYPYLLPILKTILPPNIQIIDSGFAVAKQTKKILVQHSLLSDSNKKGVSLFYTNTNPEILKTFTPKESSVEYLNF